MKRTITIPIEVTITDDIHEAGLSLQQPWIDATDPAGRSYDLTCGAGLGNGRIQASATAPATDDGPKRSAYATANIRPFAHALFAELDGLLNSPDPLLEALAEGT